MKPSFVKLLRGATGGNSSCGGGLLLGSNPLFSCAMNYMIFRHDLFQHNHSTSIDHLCDIFHLYLIWKHICNEFDYTNGEFRELIKGRTGVLKNCGNYNYNNCQNDTNSNEYKIECGKDNSDIFSNKQQFRQSHQC